MSPNLSLVQRIAQAAQNADDLASLARELSETAPTHQPPEVPNFRLDRGQIAAVVARAKDLLHVHTTLETHVAYQRTLASDLKNWLIPLADFLLAFYNPADLPTRIAAGSALAQIGLMFPNLPDAEAYRFAGFYRLSTVLHQIASPNDLPSAASKSDFITPLERAQRAQLPVPKPYLEKVAAFWNVNLPDLTTYTYTLSDDQILDHLNLDAGPNEIFHHFTRRTDPHYVRTWGRHTVYTDDILTEAERSCANRIRTRVHLSGEHDFGDRVDWRLNVFNDGEWVWFLNGLRWWEDLIEAFKMTGREKYVHRILQQLMSWTDDMPAPPGERIDWRHQYCGWRTIETGVRMGKVWPFTFQGLRHAPQFKPEHLLRFLRSTYEQTRYLLTFHQTGNWMTSEFAGLGISSILYPEFREAELWRRVAFRRLQANLASYVYPDGFQWEQSCDYHWRSVWEIQPLIEQALENNVPIPPGAVDTVTQMCDVEMYMTTPEGKLPPLNDSGVLNKASATHLQFGARLSNSDEMRYVATQGKEGHPPKRMSHHFDHAGYTVFRSDWTADATYLVFDGGPVSAGHCHEDKLSYHLHAHGSPLIIDPGTYQYVGNDTTRYLRSSHGHNTVTIDGWNQKRTHLPLTDPERIAWGPTEGKIDFGDEIESATAAYHSGYTDGENRLEVQHTRTIQWIKPHYFVISDHIQGKGTHTIEAHHHLAPAKQPDGTYQPGKIQIAQDAVVTQHSNRANVILAAAAEQPITLIDRCGSEDPFAGWCVYEHLWPCHRITFQIHAQLPVTLHTVVVPVPPQKKPDVSVRLLDPSTNQLEVIIDNKRFTLNDS